MYTIIPGRELPFAPEGWDLLVVPGGGPEAPAADSLRTGPTLRLRPFEPLAGVFIYDLRADTVP